MKRRRRMDPFAWGAELPTVGGAELRPGDRVKLSNGDWCMVTERPRFVETPARGLARLMPSFLREKKGQFMVRVLPPERPREPGAPATFLASLLVITAWTKGPGYVPEAEQALLDEAEETS
jgi:hypothetical protein